MSREDEVFRLNSENAYLELTEKEMRDKLASYEERERSGWHPKARARYYQEREQLLPAEYETKIREVDSRLIYARVKEAAAAAGLIDPDDIKSMDVSGLTIKENGEVSGVKSLIQSYQRRKPHWFKQADGGTASADRMKPVSTPERKLDSSSTNYATVRDDDFRQVMKSYGVNL